MRQNERAASAPANAPLLAASIQSRRLQTLIKGRREQLGLNQEDVAERLGITARGYGNWERGRVKEWTDTKLSALSAALEMTPFQNQRLYWIAVGRDPQPDVRACSTQMLDDPLTTALLRDYAVMMEATSLPTFLVDQRWDVKMTNGVYRDLFAGLRAHPTAMPTMNFLRFGLFHPDAPATLADHPRWQLAMLMQLAAGLDKHDQDPTLLAIRREVARHPALLDAYLNGLPAWFHNTGSDLLHADGDVLVLQHPDPRVGSSGCRVVEETPSALRASGLRHITMVLTHRPDVRAVPTCAGRSRPHHQRAA